MMKITIDEKQCERHKLSPPQLLFALACRMSKDPTEDLNDLLAREIMIESGKGLLITQHWSDIIDEIMLNSTDIGDREDWFTKLAKDFAATFPQGKMPGTAYYYRCNTREVSLKLKKFFATHPEYKPSEQMRRRIIDAGVRYNREMDLDPHYRVLAKYFISKIKTVTDSEGVSHNEEVSHLASYLENEGQENSAPQADWTARMSN